MNAKGLLFQHFEKGFCTLAVGWLLLAASSFARGPEELAVGGRLDRAITEVREYARTRRAEVRPCPDWEQSVQANLLASRVPEVEFFPGWVLHNRPNLVFRWVPMDRVTPSLEAPVMGSVVGEVEQIRVTWEANAAQDHLVLTGMTVLRREAGVAGWTVLESLPAEARACVDRSASPRKKYWYRVQVQAKLDREDSRTLALLRRGAMQELKPEQARAESSEMGPGQRLRAAFILPTGLIPPSAEDLRAGLVRGVEAVPTVTLTVYRRGDAGAWRAQPYRGVAVGAAIGQRERRSGLDFATGAVLKGVATREDAHPTIKGALRTVVVIEVVYGDGTTETFDSAMRPEQFKD